MRLKLKSFSTLLISILFVVSLNACSIKRYDVDTVTPKQTAHQVVNKKLLTDKTKIGYYVLAMSWSPEYCSLHTQIPVPPQCSREPAYRFVLHGLWPTSHRQKEKIICSKEEPSEAVITKMLAVTPSRELIMHEWKEHGRCSGLNPEQFFALARKAYQQIQIPAFFNTIDKQVTKKPEEIKTLFLLKNPNLICNSMRVININNSQLSEFRVCLDKSLNAIDCPFPVKSKPGVGIVILPPKSE